MRSNITDAEYEIMKVLWEESEPITANTVCERLAERHWAYTTVATLLSRLTDKSAVAFEKRGKSKYYTPLISEDEYREEQTKSLIGKLYGGSVKKLVASLFENKQMSESDISELKKMFELEG